ncbi:MAG: hypothetical protein AB1555_08485 [Nitrospirota bacterium]
MATSAPVVDEQLERISSEIAAKLDGGQTGALLDPDTGKREGILVSSFLENIAVFGHTGDALSLADVRHLHRTAVQAHARRALLCVPASTMIPNSVLLLATLSKIRIVRLEESEPVLW